MKKILVILSIFSIAASNCYAEDIVLLKKDQPAPYEGYLFSKSLTAKTKKELEDCDKTKEINESYKRSLEKMTDNEIIYRDSINRLQKENNNLAESLTKAQKNDGTWGYIIAFGLGIATTFILINASK